LRNANGGVAIGYSYRPDGSLDTGSCGRFLWTTGEQLRNASDAALAGELAKTGPLALNGLQGNAIEAVRPDNVPPMQSLFANYFDDNGDPALHGHLGDIAIPRGCGQNALAIPTPVTIISWWPSRPPAACPDGFVRLGRLCHLPAPRCPVGGVQCCPQGTAPGLDGACEPLRGSNFTCPVGATPIQRPDGSSQCAWLARCLDGAQADLRGGCQRFCPPGQTAWGSPKCCDDEAGARDGRCCPDRDLRDGKCVPPCPGAEARQPDGQCCADRDARDGKCMPPCPGGEARQPDGQCCADRDARDGKCPAPCRNGESLGSNGVCAPVCGPNQRIVGGQCIVQCPPGEAAGRDNLCHRTGGGGRCAPGLTRMNGTCIDITRRRACGPGARQMPNGACAPIAEPPMCPPGAIELPDGGCAPNAPPAYYDPGPRYPYVPMGPPGFGPRFPGNRGPWMGGPRRNWRPGGGRWAPRFRRY
jgi:hypothetical protein